MTGQIPKYLDQMPIPNGYYDKLDPYADPKSGKLDLKALHEYSVRVGKEINELSYDELKQYMCE